MISNSFISDECHGMHLYEVTLSLVVLLCQLKLVSWQGNKIKLKATSCNAFLYAITRLI